MSGPLSSLSKTRKTSLNKREDISHVPFREKDYDSLLDDVIDDQNTARPQVDAVEKQLGVKMMKKICDLQRQLQQSELANNEQERKIKILEEKVNFYKSSSEFSKNNVKFEECQNCLDLQSEIDDMQKFLSDYGMKWVGGDNEVSKDTRKTSFDLDTIISNINGLNELVKKDEFFLQKGKINQLKMISNEISAEFFSRGFTLDSKYRKYELGEEFLSDLQDGFFPSELQTKFPNGCYFNVKDSRENEYNVADQKTILSKLPNTVISSKGIVINVKDEVSVQIKDTQDIEIIEITSPNIEKCKDRPLSARQRTTIVRVRCADNRMFLAKFKYSDTLKLLRESLEQHKCLQFTFHSTFPKRTFLADEEEKSFYDIDLVPSANLYIKNTIT